MTGSGKGRAARAMLLACLLFASPLAVLAPARAACPPVMGPPRAVTQIVDAATLALDDGSTLRLAGILIATPRDATGVTGPWQPATDAANALRSHLSGATIRPAAAATAPDRYGQLRTLAVASRNGAEIWLQGALVAEGHARVAPLPGETECIPELLARESVARATMKGLWQNPAYAIRNASHTRRLTELIGTFQIVEGRVTAAGETRQRLYLNFGDNWRWDFTAAVPLSGAVERAALVAKLKSLTGHRIRVRGWLIRRNGPYIELASPAVIENIPDGDAGGAAAQ